MRLPAWTDGFALFGNSEALINLVERAEAVLKTQPKESLARELNKLFRDEVRTDFTRYIPREGMALLLTNAMNIEGIWEVISTRSQSKGFLEFGMKDYALKYLFQQTEQHYEREEERENLSSSEVFPTTQINLMHSAGELINGEYVFLLL